MVLAFLKFLKHQFSPTLLVPFDPFNLFVIKIPCDLNFKGNAFAEDVPLKQINTNHNNTMHYPYYYVISHELLKTMMLDSGFEEVVGELVDIVT
jgi:hypothetical protein